jgi:hypothetical protein
MHSEIDLRSVSLDLNPHSTSETQPTLNHHIRTSTTDYSKYLRIIAGIHTPSIPCAVICIAFDLIFTLITIVIGGSNLSACPVEPRIPIYLLVVGTVNLVSIFFTIVAIFLHTREKDENMIGFFYVTSSAIIIIILQFFCFIWLIFGTVWVFGVYDVVQSIEMNKSTYCQAKVYQYTEVSVVLQYMIPLIICCCKNVPLLKLKVCLF